MLSTIAALTLAVVLDNAGRYVDRFEHQLSAIVAEERYHQDWTVLPRWVSSMRDDLRRRDLVSDLLLVRVAGDWVQFRDVQEMDGRVVETRGERLVDVVRDHPPETPAEAEALLDRSAAYDVGDVARTVNTPLFALKFLEAANQRRCRFKTSSDRVPGTLVKEAELPGAFRISTEVWIVEYEERARPTIIRDRSTRSKDVPAHGRFWIEPETGRVLMSEIVAENRDVRGTIDVSYQSEPLMDLLVPVEMHEWYEGRKSGSRVETVARYGRFRNIQE